MELMGEISGEHLPRAASRGSNVDSVEDGSLHLASNVQLTKEQLLGISEDELTEKIETMLLERIKNGDKVALFQLGQLYFEQVHISCSTLWHLKQ